MSNPRREINKKKTGPAKAGFLWGKSLEATTQRGI
jgi:hypothetical protein